MVTRFPDDPPVRDDGLCVVCGKPREPERSRRYGKAEAEADPFCSSACCREWYGAARASDPPSRVTPPA